MNPLNHHNPSLNRANQGLTMVSGLYSSGLRAQDLLCLPVSQYTYNYTEDNMCLAQKFLVLVYRANVILTCEIVFYQFIIIFLTTFSTKYILQRFFCLPCVEDNDFLDPQAIKYSIKYQFSCECFSGYLKCNVFPQNKIGIFLLCKI